jgi:TPR repeat protein
MVQLTIETILAMTPEEMARRLSGPAEERAEFVRVAAEAGVSDAQAVYAQMLLDGIGVAANPQQAVAWFAKAAQQEHLVAINMVGRCYELGWGVAIDKASAASWYKAAADRGMAWAMYNYAMLLMQGDGVAEDRPAALALFCKAAGMGHVKAMNFIGSFYEDGWVVDRDMDVAADHYARAAAGGDFRGQFNHARLLAEKGRIGEAVVWLARIPETATDAFLQQARDYLDQSPIEAFRDAKALLNR